MAGERPGCVCWREREREKTDCTCVCVCVGVACVCWQTTGVWSRCQGVKRSSERPLPSLGIRFRREGRTKTRRRGWGGLPTHTPRGEGGLFMGVVAHKQVPMLTVTLHTWTPPPHTHTHTHTHSQTAHTYNKYWRGKLNCRAWLEGMHRESPSTHTSLDLSAWGQRWEKKESAHNSDISCCVCVCVFDLHAEWPVCPHMQIMWAQAYFIFLPNNECLIFMCKDSAAFILHMFLFS